MSGKIGNTIPQVTIGTQTWMLYNLDTTTYRNGDIVISFSSPGNNSNNISTYGRMYTWDAANDPRGLAPKGFHIPTQAEWNTLITYVGGTSAAAINTLKSTTLWTSNGGGTNTTGFTAVPAGANSGNLGVNTFFWTSTSISSTSAYSFLMGSTNRLGADGKQFLFSVRCIRDY
jgi:uncharacterized protein (TIGR02145 family)